jgi:membrane dipeptidase
MASDIIVSDAAKSLHYNSMVIDGLEAAPMNSEHFMRLQRGGVNIVNYTCAKVTDDFSSAALNVNKLQKTIDANHDNVLLVNSASDIYVAHEKNKIGLMAGFQNATPIMDKLEYVELLYKLGVRVIQLTYNERNLLGDGCIETTDGGLSRFGIQVVHEMNRLGMVIDISHCGEQTTLDSIKASNSPVLITHANAKELCPSLRNKSDAVLQALVKNRGVIGVAFWAPMTYNNPNFRPKLDDLLNHIDYIVGKIGINHVGIGSDLGEGESREYYESMFIKGGGLYPEITKDLGDWYSFENRMVEQLESAVSFPLITEGLLKRGYSDGDISKILGENILRVLNKVIE